MILLVCGGRFFGLTKDEQWFIYEGIYDTLIASQGPDHLELIPEMHIIRSGAAPGVDTVALEVAKLLEVMPDAMPVTQEEYDLYKKGAPTKRNARMAIKIPIPDLVLAFNGGPGTQDMINKANKLKIPVKRLIMGDGITKFME
jgi:hypothetical protein